MKRNNGSNMICRVVCSGGICYCRKITGIMITAIMFLSFSKIAVCQEVESVSELIKFNIKVHSLFNEVTRDTLQLMNAEELLMNLRKSSLSRSPEYFELLNKIMPKFISGRESLDKESWNYFVQMGGARLIIADQKLNRVIKKFGGSDIALLKLKAADSTVYAYNNSAPETMNNSIREDLNRPAESNPAQAPLKIEVPRPDTVKSEQKKKTNTEEEPAQISYGELEDGIPDQDTGIIPEEIENEGGDEGELSGLVIDETISKIGKDFSEYFSGNWQKPNKQIEYTISIQEKPLPGNGSQILVYVDDYLLFQNFVQPRADVIEAYADYAISMVNNYLENYELIQQQLQGDDLSGTGIY